MSSYKETDVGLVPVDWETPMLRERLQQDATYGIVTAGRFLRSGVPMLRGGDIKGGAVGEGQPLISEDKNREYSRTILREGDVVIALVGYPGESAVVPAKLVGANISRAVGLLRPAKNLLSSYLACYLNSPSGRKEFLRPSAGSAQIVVNLGALNKLVIPVPSPKEQSAIATALSDVDALLAAQDALIAKKRAIKQGAMQELLTGKRRLPGFSGEWGMKSLDMVSTRATGVWGSTMQDERRRRIAEVIRAGDISADGRLTGTATRYVSDEEFTAAKCEYDDLVITTSGNGLGKLWWCDGRKNIAASNFVRVIHPKLKEATGLFLYYALRSDVGMRQLVEHTATSAYPNLRPTYFTEAWLPAPGKAEQMAIAKVLFDMDAVTDALEAKREKTAQLKQGMMQALLTGRIRLV